MRRGLLGLVLGVCCVCAASAEPLTPKAFTDAFVRVLAAKMPAGAVSTKGDLYLTIKRNGRESPVHLENPYRDYLRDPDRLEEILARFAAAFPLPAPAVRVDQSRIVPVIKERGWADEVRAQLDRERSPAPREHKVEAFNDDLVIVYAEDYETGTRFLRAGEDVGVSGGELRALAIANLKRVLPPIQVVAYPAGFSVLSAGGDYDASLLLIDDIWRSADIKVEGDIVVAVPARNVLLVTGSRSRTGLKAVRAVAADVIKGGYPLTDTLFVYRGGKFVRFGSRQM
jgi:uncharacterized protein YtpQ (UPF0354 family)